ncbi:MAG: TldD/PmbA family protein [Bacilli bacterium]|nr:TldD/PmbA family protein [Bacilli bacterium]
MLNYQELINKAKDYGFSDIQVNESTEESLTLFVSNGLVEKNNSANLTSVIIKGIYNGKLATLELEDLNRDVDAILSELKESASFITSKEECEIFAGSASYPEVKEEASDYVNYPTSYKIEKLIQLEKDIKAVDPRIVAVPYCVYGEEKHALKIVNSKGLDLAKSVNECAVFAQVVAMENGQASNGSKETAKINLADLDFDKVLKDSTKEALDHLNAKSTKSGAYDVVIENNAMSSLFSTYQTMYNGEAALRKMAFLAGKENTKVFNEMVNIIDDPLMNHEEVLHKTPFDSEGVACYTKDLVKDGVFKGLIHNLKTAKAFGTTSTGNASNTSVRGYNTYIAPGKKSKEELLADLGNGLLITDFDGLHAGVNPISGDFNLKCAGFVIENGKIVRPVTLIVMAGNFYKMLNDNIFEIGSDLTFSRGIGAPSILFKNVAISGE